MDNIQCEMIDDLKYKLREKIDEKASIAGSIVPMKEYIAQFSLVTVIIDALAFVFSFAIGNSFLSPSKAMILALVLCGGATSMFFPAIVAGHREDLKIQKKKLEEKENEIKNLVAAIKEMEKKKKVTKEDNISDIDEKTIIKEEDFLYLYSDSICDDVNIKTKKLGTR